MNRIEIKNLPPLEYASKEAMNTLCTNLSYCGFDIKTIMITSRYAFEGKSYLAMNLMRSMAGLKKRVVLLDADLRRSGISSGYHLSFEKNQNYGLAHYLAGMCQIEDVLYSTNIENAFMVPIGREVSNSLPLLTSPRMQSLTEYLAGEFDAVLVDTPPAGMISDALEMAKYCDGTLLVVSQNRGRRSEIADIVKSIEKTGSRVLGAVLNNVDFKAYGNRKFYFNSERYSTYYSRQYTSLMQARDRGQRKNRKR